MDLVFLVLIYYFPHLLAPNSFVSLRFDHLVLVWGRTRERNSSIRLRKPVDRAPDRTSRPSTRPTGRQTGAAGAQPGPTDHKPGSRLRHRLTPPPTTTTTIISTIAGITCSDLVALFFLRSIPRAKLFECCETSHEVPTVRVCVV